MSPSTAENAAVSDLQRFVNEICAPNGATISHIDALFKIQASASAVSRADVHDTFLQLYPKHEKFRERLSRVGMSNPHLSDELWQAAKSLGDRNHRERTCH